jgi:hypothetical protein
MRFAVFLACLWLCAACGCSTGVPSRCTGAQCGEANESRDGSTNTDAGDAQASSTEPVRIAFVGDLGVKEGQATEEFNQVLALANQEADLLVLGGDMIYSGSQPADWHRAMQQLSIPYIAAQGNHDTDAWPGFEPLIRTDIEQQASRGLACTGATGVQQTCTFAGVTFVLSGIGTAPSVPADDATHLSWMSSALSNASTPWKVCVWHKNQREMQVGGKSDEVGWRAYQTCQQAGAVIATAHEHSYGRTKTLTAIGAAPHGESGAGNALTVGLGKTFVFHSGIGGNDIRTYNQQNWSWFASYYTSDAYRRNGVVVTSKPSATAGIMVITFRAGALASKATGQFKLIDGQVIDDFDVTLQ